MVTERTSQRISLLAQGTSVRPVFQQIPGLRSYLSRQRSSLLIKEPSQDRTRCKAAFSATPLPLTLRLWALEAAEGPDLTTRLASVAAIDLAIVALLTTSLVYTWSSKTSKKIVLDDHDKLEGSKGGLAKLWGRAGKSIAKAAESLPTGASIMVLAEQETVMTDEVGALEDCLVDSLNDDRDLAASFLVLFITAIKRTWLANTISEAVMISLHRQQCSLSAAALLLDRISQPKARFRAPLETLLVNGELMEAIATYSLVIVIKAKKLFRFLDDLKAAAWL